jgi:lipoprotein-anchoring transpeptidase ErfK/SrfK
MPMKMRKQVFLAVTTAALLIGAFGGVEALARNYWDQAQQKWVKYEGGSTSMKGSRSYQAIHRQVVSYKGPYSAPTIVINTAERRLYYIFENGKAMKYGIGVGREGFQWSGVDYISRKAEWPGWTPPPEMIVREKKRGRILPAHMEGGPRNPLGARALYVGSTMYRIHGSNEPWTIGRAVSSGCIRLTNNDVVDLYNRVPVGTRVVVLRGDEPTAKTLVAARPEPKGFLALLTAKEPPPPKGPPKAVGSVKKKGPAKADPVVTARLKDDSLPAATIVATPPVGPVVVSTAGRVKDDAIATPPAAAAAVEDVQLEQTAVR